MKRTMLATLAIAALAAAALMGAASPAQADFSSAWSANAVNEYAGGQFVYTNASAASGMLTGGWSSVGSNYDLKFEAAYAHALTGANGVPMISSFGTPGNATPTYGQVVTVPVGAGALTSFTVYVSRTQGSAPYTVKALVMPFNLAGRTPAGPPLWVSAAFDLALATSGETRVWVTTPDISLTEGATYVLALTTLDVASVDYGASTGSSAQNLIYQSVGNTGKCDASRGYAASWAEWPRDGKGGPVCDRTLLWTDARGWVPAAFDAALNRYVPIDGATM